MKINIKNRFEAVVAIIIVMNIHVICSMQQQRCLLDPHLYSAPTLKERCLDYVGQHADGAVFQNEFTFPPDIIPDLEKKATRSLLLGLGKSLRIEKPSLEKLKEKVRTFAVHMHNNQLLSVHDSKDDWEKMNVGIWSADRAFESLFSYPRRITKFQSINASDISLITKDDNNNNQITIYDLEAKKVQRNIGFGRSLIRDFSIIDGNMVVCTNDKKVHVVDVRSNTNQHSLLLDGRDAKNVSPYDEQYCMVHYKSDTSDFFHIQLFDLKKIGQSPVLRYARDSWLGQPNLVCECCNKTIVLDHTGRLIVIHPNETGGIDQDRIVECKQHRWATTPKSITWSLNNNVLISGWHNSTTHCGLKAIEEYALKHDRIFFHDLTTGKQIVELLLPQNDELFQHCKFGEDTIAVASSDGLSLCNVKKTLNLAVLAQLNKEKDTAKIEEEFRKLWEDNS